MKCKDCFFYNKLKYSKDEIERGFCHRFPPTPPEDLEGVCFAVQTYNDHWCGEFKENYND